MPNKSLKNSVFFMIKNIFKYNMWGLPTQIHEAPKILTAKDANCLIDELKTISKMLQSLSDSLSKTVNRKLKTVNKNQQVLI